MREEMGFKGEARARGDASGQVFACLCSRRVLHPRRFHVKHSESDAIKDASGLGSTVRIIFPRWMNLLPTATAVIAPVAMAAVVAGAWYWLSPGYTDVGYQPRQPVEFSHKLHAGTLGMDCRYCHNTVEVAARAAIPPTATCMNCHKIVKAESEKLALVRESFETGAAIPWVRVHQLPDYAYFDHSVHLAASVGCESCHGRIDQMERVTLMQPLSMGWCLDCHRQPGPHLRPPREITHMGYVASTNGFDRTRSPNGRLLAPPEHCSGCHR